MNGDDGNLCVGLLVEFLAESGQFGAGVGVDHAGKIVDVALRGELANFLAVRDGCGKEEEKGENRRKSRQPPSGKARIINGFNFSFSPTSIYF
jgi:hypothetical protein